jgi:hypothetical protein
MIVIWLILVTLFGAFSQNAAQCPDGPGGVFPNPEVPGCTSYLQCSWGNFWVHNCRAGYLFNPNRGYCDWSWNYQCPSSPASTTTSTSAPAPAPAATPAPAPAQCPDGQGGLIPNPEVPGCTSFLQCSWGVAVVKYCPSGTVFNPVGLCDWPANYPCPAAPASTTTSASAPTTASTTASTTESTTEPTTASTTVSTTASTAAPTTASTTASTAASTTASTTAPTTAPPSGSGPCSPGENSEPFENPSDCSTYLQCVHGAAIVSPCLEGLVFNPNPGYCDWPANYPNCPNGNGGPEPTPAPTPAPTTSAPTTAPTTEPPGPTTAPTGTTTPNSGCSVKRVVCYFPFWTAWRSSIIILQQKILEIIF